MLELNDFEDDVMEIRNYENYEVPEAIDITHGPSLRSGTRTISGYMPAGVLLQNFKVPYFNHTSKQGYQRAPQPSRISQLAADMRRDRVDLPTAILLNVRGKPVLKSVRGNRFFLGELLASSADLLFYIVDGQHRALAIEKAIADGWSEGKDFLIPFTCMLGADENEEMAQFYIVNSTAKAVRTDLAYALIKRRAETESGVMEALQEKGKEWQVIGQTIVERMAAESVVWRGRIRLPSMEKGGTIIPSASMVSSLKPVLGSPFFGRMSIDQQLALLEAYWEGIRHIMRDAFDNPADHSVQKGIGVITLHTLLAEVIEIVRDRGLPPLERDSYVGILEPALTGLQGENADGDPVDGLEFWAAAPKGAAGSYSSSAGRRVLMAKIRSLLPRLDLN